MRAQLLIPSMQYHREAHLTAEVVLAEIEQRLRCGMEQQIQQQSLILLAKENQCVELVRQRKRIVEVRYGEKLSATIL